VIEISNKKFTDSVPYQLFTKYVVSPLVILSIRYGDYGDHSCFYTDGCLGIERAGTGGRGRKGDKVKVRCVRHQGSRVLNL
jgi:hypothetical protein